MKKTTTGKLVLLTSLVLACALLLGLALPAAASFGGNLLINGSFDTDTSSWVNGPDDTFSYPWTYNAGALIVTEPDFSRDARISQCIEITDTNGGENFELSALLSGGTYVVADFFTDTTCGEVGTGYDQLTLGVEQPQPAAITVAPAAHAVLVTGVCPIESTCDLDDISLVGESTTAVQLGSLNARSQTGWLLPVGLLAVLLAGALAAFCAARRRQA